jgi:hypothetical protein
VRLVHNDGRLRKLDETASEQGSERSLCRKSKATQRAEQAKAKSERRKAKTGVGRDGRECRERRETGRQESRSRGDEEATSRRG